jgi:predicted Zn-dependent protease
MDPEHLANFLYRLSQEKTDVPKSLEWLSTHPNSSDRAAEIIRLRKETPVTPEPIADSLGWAGYRRRVKDAASE